MMLVASMPLSININAAEFPWYTLQIVAAVLLIVDLEGDKSSLKHAQKMVTTGCLIKQVKVTYVSTNLVP